MALAEMSNTAGQTPGTRLVMSTTLAENFADDRLKLLVSTSKILTDPFGSALILELKSSFSNSWNDRKKWLVKGFGLPLDRDASWHKMNVVIAVRNAIVHGRDTLTDKQTSNAVTAMKLRSDAVRFLGLHVEGGRMLLSSRADESAIAITSEFVLRLDCLVAERARNGT